MSQPTSLKVRLTKPEAESIVRKCVAKEENQNHLVPMDTLRQTDLDILLKTKQYQKYICAFLHKFKTPSGWIMSKYVTNGFCIVPKGIFELDTGKDGTNRFGNHMISHLSPNG